MRSTTANLEVYGPGNESDQARGSEVRAALSMAKPNQTIDVGPGRYDLGNVANVLMPGGRVKLRGWGAGETVLYSSWFGPFDQGCVFECCDGVEFENLTLQSMCPINEQTELVGFGRVVAGSVVSNATVRFGGCELIGRGFTVYNWAGPGNKLLLDRCRLVGARRLLTQGLSSGAGASVGYIEAIDCLFDGNASLSSYIGLVGKRVSAICGRGGVIKAYNPIIRLRGNSLSEGLSAVWIDPKDSHPGTQITVANPVFELEPATVPAGECWDVDYALGSIVLRGSVAGSAADGSALIRKPAA